MWGIEALTDAEARVHFHLSVNSVSLEDGRKPYISEPKLIELRQRNDRVCEMFDLPSERSEKEKDKPMSAAEYHAAARGESWKFRLMCVIN